MKEPNSNRRHFDVFSWKRAITYCFLIVFTCFSPPPHAIAQQPLLVSYPVVEDNHIRDFDHYFLALLKLGLDKSGQPYHMEPYRTATFVESRSEFNLRQNRYNIHWMHTNPTREAELIPVRIPLFKGLIGWRLFFIKRGTQKQFSNISSLEELRQFSLGQGHDWPDTEILKSNGLRIETSTQWDSLFLMLSKQRFDLFPRSIIEIWREKQIFNQLDIQVEDHLALNYPAAYYFFVSPKHAALAEALEDGLTKAVDDGAFDSIFYDQFGEIIKRARLDQRLILHLNNPKLSYPKRPELWYRPVAPQM